MPAHYHLQYERTAREGLGHYVLHFVLAPLDRSRVGHNWLTSNFEACTRESTTRGSLLSMLAKCECWIVQEKV